MVLVSHFSKEPPRFLEKVHYIYLNMPKKMADLQQNIGSRCFKVLIKGIIFNKMKNCDGDRAFSDIISYGIRKGYLGFQGSK